MSRRETLLFSAVLVVLGSGWGVTQSLTKIAVSTGHQQFGLIFWQVVIGAFIMGTICAFRGIGLPLNARALRLYLVIAMVGTILPDMLIYQAAVFLPAGILSLVLSMIPLFAFPIAMALGTDTFSWKRLLGLCFGLLAVLLLTVPGADFGVSFSTFWLLVALFAGLFYAFEGNYVARWGTEGLDPFQVLLGASLIAMLLMTPTAFLTGQFIDPRQNWGPPEFALIASSVSHIFTYAGYVWLVGRAGPVFAVQVSYLVTAFGIFWAWVILSETYSPLLWVALGLMFFGMYLVQPKPQLAVDGTMGDTDRSLSKG